MTTPETIPLQRFITDRGLRMSCKPADHNPHMDDLNWAADHWRCQFRLPGDKGSFSCYFSKGIGHKGAKPTAEEVLDCIASDVAGYLNANSFDDWCEEYGYDTDSRKMLKTYKVIERQYERLERMLGKADVELLAFHTDRL